MMTPQFLLLALAVGTSALPPIQTRATSADDGSSCLKIRDTCKAQLANSTSHTDAWSHKACVLAATCFGGQVPVNGLLAFAFANVTTAPVALNQTRVKPTIFSPTPGTGLTLQNYIDAYYGQLSEVGGPYPPDTLLVQTYYERVQTWTAFCGKPVPWFNFADYFEYSPTVSSPGCTPVTTPTPPISSDATCQKLFDTCKSILSTSAALKTATWSQKSCVLAATCFPGQTPVNGLLAAAWPAGTTPTPVALTQSRVQNLVLGQTGSTLSLQNFIDAYYGQLSAVGGPYPANTDLVKTYYQRIQTWTAFCGTKAIPWFNVADYFQYSPTVSSPGCSA